MALQFALANTQYLVNATLLGITDYPFTFACWFSPTSTSLSGADSYTLMSFGQQAGNARDALLWLEDNGASNSLIAAFNDTDVVTGRAQSSQPTADTWQHACAVFASSTSRSCYYNGSNKATNTDAEVFPSSSNFRVAARAIGTPKYYDGSLAEVAIWAAALDDAEVAALAKGFAPTLIRPTSLAAYYPLMRGDNNGATHFDRWKSSFNASEGGTGSPTQVNHTRMIYPAGIL